MQNKISGVLLIVIFAIEPESVYTTGPYYFPLFYIIPETTLILQKPGGIGLPDKPVVMHDLNLEEMMVPRLAPQQQPTGKLKVQFQFNSNKTALTVIVIEVRNKSIGYNNTTTTTTNNSDYTPQHHVRGHILLTFVCG